MFVFSGNPAVTSNSNKRTTLSCHKKEFGGISCVQTKGEDALGSQEKTGTEDCNVVWTL